MNKLLNTLLATISLLICWTLFEYALNVTFPDPFQEKKSWVHLRNEYGVCFSSNPSDYFEYNLNIGSDFAEFEKMFVKDGNQPSLEQIKKETPYCQLHHPQNRFQGFCSHCKENLVIVGDSFAFGESLRDRDTLQQHLQDQLGDFNVKNLAWPGQNILYAQNRVSFTIQQRLAKHIIYFYNLNDVIMSPELGGEFGAVATDFQNLWASKLQGTTSDSKPSFFESLRSHQLYRIWKERNSVSAKTSSLYLRAYDERDNKDGLSSTFHALAQMIQDADEAGIVLNIAVYPLLYKTAWGEYPMQIAHDKVIKECLKVSPGKHCIDLSPAFSSYRTLKSFNIHNIDFHPNGEANKLVVKYLLEHPAFSLAAVNNHINESSKRKEY